MSDHPFTTALGRIAVIGSDFGADCAYRAILDLLARHQMHEAHELVEAYGRESIDVALRAEAWRSEQEPAVGHTEPTNSEMPSGTNAQGESHERSLGRKGP